MNSERLRVFIAICLSDEVREKLKKAIETLGKIGCSLKCVKPENAHLTLKFIGAIPGPKLEGIKGAMECALKGTSPFEISFCGAGIFPRVDIPRVVWIGVKKGEEKLKRIKVLLEENLSNTGIEKESREHHSHLTLGRIKSPRGKNNLLSWVKSNADLSLGIMTVRKIVLMQSTLRKDSPEYTPLGIVNLDTIKNKGRKQ